MMKKIASVLFFLFILSFALGEALGKPKAKAIEQPKSQEAEQKMMDFSLAGYTQRGKKSWEVKGDSADIFSDIVKLTSINADVYGEEENINLVADKGDYYKASGKMHLEENVVITTQSGGRLTTDSLDWDRESQRVTTQDTVNIEKQNIKAKAEGLDGQPNLKKIALRENVQVQVKEEKSDLEEQDKKPTVITCDGPLDIDYDKEVAYFNNNVKVDQEAQGQMYADRMEVQFDFKNKKILRIKSTGNVKIVKGENTSYSEEALYVAADKKMTLIGRPRLVIYSEKEIVDAPSGN